MDFSPRGLLLNTLPVIPIAIKTLLSGLLGYSPNSKSQDVLTEVTCILLRPSLSTPAALLESQRQSCKDYGIWGRMWIAKYTILAPLEKHELKYTVLKAIQDLGNEEDVAGLNMPEVENVEVEWTGFRADASMWERRPDISEREQYSKMMEEVDMDAPVILYFHGGAFCLMDPSTHRFTTSALARQTHGRVVSVRYRLSPQHPFPAALLDALSSYLALISPPPGAFHPPIPASRIVLAGDSSGAGLAASLQLLLLHLSRSPTGIYCNGEKLVGSTLVPAGMALTSPWLDITRALPSVHQNARYDIVAPPPLAPCLLSQPHPAFPQDSIWPATAPRVETYCDARMVAHPLVSPLSAKPAHWRGAGPVWLCVGWESMQDEAEVVARRMNEGGVVVIFEGYEGMPHCFSSMFSWSALSRMAFENWGVFCARVVKGEVGKSKGSWRRRGGLREVQVGRLGFRDGIGRKGEDLNDAVVDALMSGQRAWRVRLEGLLRGVYKGLEGGC